VTISSVQACKTGAFKQVRCNLPVDFILDLGAKVSIISCAQYESSSLRLNGLQPSDVTLRTYRGLPIACLGRIQLPVSLGETHLPSFTFYVAAKGESVMGVDLFDALGGSVQLGDTSLISRPIDVMMSLSLSATSVSLADYPTFTKWLRPSQRLLLVQQLGGSTPGNYNPVVHNSGGGRAFSAVI
jgi:hypothetical protein